MSLFPVYSLFDIEPVKALGCQLWDAKGVKYMDLYGGHGVISIGHSHPRFVEAIEEQLRKITFYSNSVQIPIQKELARNLTELANYPDYQLFMCNSGAEANENALKVASFATGRSRVLAFKGAFHGRTSGAVAVTDNPKIISPFNANHQVDFVNLNDIDVVEQKLLSKRYAAVIIEGIQGVGGLNMPTDEFLQSLRTVCTSTGTALIADEVQAGFGRTGKFFAHQHAGIEADIISMAKGMGNGFPVGGILVSPEYKAWPGMLGTTFGGNYLACAAALTVVNVIRDERLMENAAKLGLYFDQLFVNEKIKGRGLMKGLDLGKPVKEIRRSLLFDKRIFTGAAADPNVLRILPPLHITQEELELFQAALNEVLQNETIYQHS